MRCEVCAGGEATIHVLERPTDDPPVESHYCVACYDRGFVHPPDGWIAVDDGPPRPADPPAFPLSRFTLGSLMTVAAAFAVGNAAAVLILRQVVLPSTPPDGAIRALFVFNFGLAVLLCEYLVMAWLGKLVRHRKRVATSMGLRFPDRRRFDHIDTLSNLFPRERAFYLFWNFWCALCLFEFVLPVFRPGSWIFAGSAGRFLAPLLVITGVWAVLLRGLVAATRRK